MRLLAIVFLAFMTTDAVAQRTVYQSPAFTITDTSVHQGQFHAYALSREQIISNYQRAAVEVNFKFSINGLDNEHPPGDDYMIYVRPRGGRIATPVYKFGVLEPPRIPEPELAAASREEGAVDVTFRLDMRHVLDSLRTHGSYKPPNGARIRAPEFSGVYIIGNVLPLSWDFGRLKPGAPVQLHDPDGDGIYEVTLQFNATFSRPLTLDGNALWTRSRDLGRFPLYRSPQRLADALYQLSLEELLELKRDDGALNAGGRWPGVWTRDAAWAALLSFVFAAPAEVLRNLSERIDKSGRVIQDSGSGGSWPISTDRVSWALAAWELYAVTGDRSWLRTAYDALRRSAEADLTVAYDPRTGLFRGESSFLDWRDQSYPSWMDPKDIAGSYALGTNALHYGAYRVLANMARELGESATRWEQIAESVKRGINEHLWQAERGYYGQFRYGRLYHALSPRAEHLGEALAVITGVTDSVQRTQVVRSAPVVEFGVPSFWPYTPNIPPYHNAGLWPQVAGFWAWAAADAGNGAAVEHALASIQRATALFLTNKENVVAQTGHFEGTEVNSDRFGASVAAQLGNVYRVLFGLRLHADRLEFRPFIPESYAGTRTLEGLRYRDAVLDVAIRGFGNAPRRVTLDGRAIARAEIPATLRGRHRLEITMNGVLPRESIALSGNEYAPAMPQVTRTGQQISWQEVPGAVRYEVVRNGVTQSSTMQPRAQLPVESATAEYQVRAIDAAGRASFLSEPIDVAPALATVTFEPNGEREQQYAGHSNGYVTLTPERAATFTVSIAKSGTYAIDARYANGSGPVSYGYKAAIRTLLVNDSVAGSLVMPQRGQQRWENWGYSTAIQRELRAGTHTFALTFRPTDWNMSDTASTALVDHLRLRETFKRVEP